MKLIDYFRAETRALVRIIAKSINNISGGRVSANMVTTVGLIMHVPIMILIIYGDFIWAAIFLLFFGAFDILDGELARLTKKANSYGMVYDASTDRIKIGLVMAGVAQYLAINGQPEWVFVPVMALVVVITVSYVKAKGEVALALKKPKMTHHQVNRFYTSGIIPHDLLYIVLALGLITGQVLLISWIVLILRGATLFSMINKVSRIS